MKRWLILCILLFTIAGCSLETSCADDPNCTRVLFIGNSYTYVNDLPATFTKLAKSGGHRVETGISAQGGWFLSDHVNSAETLDLIKSSKWNFVALQEQSQAPASGQVRVTRMYPAARTLVRKIKESGATPILFITWAHRDGWAENNLPSYESMQSAVDKGYLTLGQELKMQMAPVGPAWLKTWQQDPKLNLWQEDGSHPNEKGTYLAACVFYTVIYRESPEGLTYKGNLSKEESQLLQKISAGTVLSRSSFWNIP
jgi:hypothetical protein